MMVSDAPIDVQLGWDADLDIKPGQECFLYEVDKGQHYVSASLRPASVVADLAAKSNEKSVGSLTRLNIGQGKQ